MTERIALSFALLVGSALPDVALAHPRIDQARAAYERADLDAAHSAIDAAFDVGHLSREEYLEALVLRALIAIAGQRNVQRDDSLRQLAAIAPDYELPAEAPPSLRRRFREIHEELGGERVSARLTLTRGRDRFTARLRLTDPVRVVVSTTLVCRSGDDVFQAEGTDVFGLVGRWRSVECVAQLLGRGGTLLGSIERELEGEGVAPNAPCVGPNCPDGGGGSDDALAIGLGVGIPLGLIAVAAVILTAVLVSEASSDSPSNVFLPPRDFSDD